MTLRYQAPRRFDHHPQLECRLIIHTFYSTPLSFCTISPSTWQPESFSVSYTKWMRIGLLLSSPFSYSLRRIKGSCLFFSPCPLTDGSCWAALRDYTLPARLTLWPLYLEGANCVDSHFLSMSSKNSNQTCRVLSWKKIRRKSFLIEYKQKSKFKLVLEINSETHSWAYKKIEAMVIDFKNRVF